jgi:hypothetical protein
MKGREILKGEKRDVLMITYTYTDRLNQHYIIFIIIV